MRTLAEDTSPDAERLLVEQWRRCSPAQKVEMIVLANQAERERMVTDLSARFPHDSPARLRRRLASVLLGEDLAAKAYGAALPA